MARTTPGSGPTKKPVVNKPGNASFAKKPASATQRPDAPRIGTRARIVKESGRLFAEFGFSATTIVQIEEAVGLSPGSGALYRHFASKQDILHAVFAEAQARLEALRAASDLAIGAPTPAPDDDALTRQLLMAYTMVNLGSEATRDIAMIYFKDGASLGEEISSAMRRSSSEAFERTAKQMDMRRSMRRDQAPRVTKRNPNNKAKTAPRTTRQQASNEDEKVDAMAEAFLFLTPILYAKLIDWLEGSLPNGLTHERIAKAWAKQQVRLRGEHGDRSGLT